MYDFEYRIDGDYNDVEWTETKIYNLTQEKKAGISALKKNQKTQQQQRQEEGTSKYEIDSKDEYERNEKKKRSTRLNFVCARTDNGTQVLWVERFGSPSHSNPKFKLSLSSFEHDVVKKKIHR